MLIRLATADRRARYYSQAWQIQVEKHRDGEKWQIRALPAMVLALLCTLGCGATRDGQKREMR